jgi:hypothetical protein
MTTDFKMSNCVAMRSTHFLFAVATSYSTYGPSCGAVLLPPGAQR